MKPEEVKEERFYRVSGSSPYFFEKYGTPNPVIVIQCEHKKVYGRHYLKMGRNLTCALYKTRKNFEKLPDDSPEKGEVFFGRIQGKPELVHASELEPE